MSGFFTGLVTILAMLTFFGIVWWAWSSKRKKDNDKASMLPFDLPDEYDDQQSDKATKRTGDLDE